MAMNRMGFWPRFLFVLVASTLLALLSAYWYARCGS